MFRETHGVKQLDYVLWKHSMFYKFEPPSPFGFDIITGTAAVLVTVTLNALALNVAVVGNGLAAVTF